ncbi:MAG: DUF5666 domain-containing protein [Anaerolineae bacterium]
MRKLSIVAILILVAGLMAATGQAMAGPAGVTARNTGNPHGTEEPAGTEMEPGHTPGAQATAHAGLHGKPQILRGTISAVDASSITLTLADGSSVSVGITPQTKIHVPGPQSAGDTLVTGMRAVVMAYNDPNGGSGLVARMVIAIPGQPVRAHRVGTVTAYTAGSSITIQAKDGNSYTFALTADTKILPEERAAALAVGSLVTVIAPRVPASTGWTAKGIVVHPAP